VWIATRFIWIVHDFTVWCSSGISPWSRNIYLLCWGRLGHLRIVGTSDSDSDFIENCSQTAKSQQPLADDMQCSCSGSSSEVFVMASRVQRCATDVSDWYSAQRLQLNADNTELLWFGPASQLRQISSDNLAIYAEPERHQAVVSSSSPGRLVRHWPVNAPTRLSHITNVLFSPAPSALSSSSTIGRDVTTRLYSSRVAASRLLQRHSRWFTGVDT